MAGNKTNQDKIADRAISWGERLWKVLQLFGWADRLSLLAAGLLASAWSWAMTVFATIPWWATILTALLFATLCMHLWIKARVAWSLRGLKTLDLSEFAKDCNDFYRDFSTFMVSGWRVDRNE